MVALYFELFPDEVDDYECWLNSEYDEDEDYSDYKQYSNFEKTLFFDIVLKKYIDDLNIEQLHKILLTGLKSLMMR